MAVKLIFVLCLRVLKTFATASRLRLTWTSRSRHHSSRRVQVRSLTGVRYEDGEVVSITEFSRTLDIVRKLNAYVATSVP
ncbi:hypothetical protein C8R45DRAFT_961232 [Mycena sanguinolenta]|nr:hypothetical protein C8R45DRAFT_961232 [Mycena sanguinolenta]